VTTVKNTVAGFVTCNLYFSGQWARIELKVIMENDRDFMEETHIQLTP